MSCQRAWYVRPVALADAEESDDSNDHVDGTAAAECLKWLGQQKEGSLVFVCPGSYCTFDDDQIREMALGLESSAVPFLWALKGSETCCLPEGWEERTRSKGMALRGWAPQVAILGHMSVGAFLTHSGWNSQLEAASAGVPMLSWPLEFDQFISERLTVDVAGIGKRVFDGVRSTRHEERVVVPGETIGSVIARFMEEGEHGKLREWAKEYTEMVKAAVRENGSSYRDLNRMLDDIMERIKSRRDSTEVVTNNPVA